MIPTIDIDPKALDAVVEAELVRRSLADAVKYFWPVHHADPAIWNWHMDAICDHIQAVFDGEFDRLIINVPPGLAKSLTTSVYAPGWRWLTKPQDDFLSISGNPDVVMRDAKRMRDLVEHDRYQRIVSLIEEGRAWGIPSGQRKLSYFYNGKGGARISKSRGQKITGNRTTYILVDDLVDVREALESPETVLKANQWFDDALSNRRKLGVRTAIIVIMQRLHDDDLTGHLLRTQPGRWEHLCLRSEYDPDDPVPTTALGFQDPRTERGELLAPNLLTEQEIADVKATPTGSATYEAQYMQRPSSKEGRMFKRRDVRFYTAAELPEAFDHIVISADLTEGAKTKDAHYNSIQAWAQRGKRRYLLRTVHGRWSLSEQKAQIEALGAWAKARFGRVDAFLIEDKAKGPAVIEYLRGLGFQVIAFDPKHASKDERAELAAILFEEHCVYLPDPTHAPWVHSLFLSEVLSYPLAAYDDQVDAMSQYLVWSSSSNLDPWIFTLG